MKRPLVVVENEYCYLCYREEPCIAFPVFDYSKLLVCRSCLDQADALLEVAPAKERKP